MTIELGDKLPSTAPTNGESKPMKEFYMLKNLAAGHVIEGIHKGRFESKKTAGYFFHVMTAADGESYAYGACQALDDRLNEVKKASEESGQTLYAKIKYNGRIPSKKNPKMTYYSFSAPELYPVKGETKAPGDAITSSEIPF